MSSPPSLRVAVTVELERGPGAGGHVKCWERLAAAAGDGPEGLDLTLFVLGRGAPEELGPRARVVPLRPVLGNRPLTHLVGGVDPSDMAPFHPGLARHLLSADVWHLTHALAFSATAMRLRRFVRRPIVVSLHTDVPMLTGVYTRDVVDRLPGRLPTWVRRTGLEALPRRAATARQGRLLRASDHVLASNDLDEEAVRRSAPGVPVTRLRRGLDTRRFRPDEASRRWLEDRHGLPPEEMRALFVGRVDRTKGVLLAAAAVAASRRAGCAVRLVVAGEGAAQGPVKALLGDGVTFLGKVPQQDLARVYAGSDLLAFPSRSETAGNVVGEAMASGLPVLLPHGARTLRWLAEPGTDGVVVEEDSPSAWAEALSSLLRDPERRRRIGAHAQASVRRCQPSWAEVLTEDLVPVWRTVQQATTRSVSTLPPSSPDSPAGGGLGSPARGPA